MRNIIIYHSSYIIREITRARLKEKIAEIRYIQVIGPSRRSPGENPVPRTEESEEALPRDQQSGGGAGDLGWG